MMEVRKMALAGMMAAAAFISFVYLRLEIPLFFGLTGKVYIGYTFILLAGLLAGRWYGAFAGAIGLTLADVMAGYLTSAIPTFFSFLIMGYMAGLLADRYRRGETEKKSMPVTVSILACTVFGLAEPVIRSTFKYFVLGYPLPMAIGAAGNVLFATILSAIPSILLVGMLYPALRRALPQETAALIDAR